MSHVCSCTSMLDTGQAASLIGTMERRSKGTACSKVVSILLSVCAGPPAAEVSTYLAANWQLHTQQWLRLPPVAGNARCLMFDLHITNAYISGTPGKIISSDRNCTSVLQEGDAELQRPLHRVNGTS